MRNPVMVWIRIVLYLKSKRPVNWNWLITTVLIFPLGIYNINGEKNYADMCDINAISVRLYTCCVQPKTVL